MIVEQSPEVGWDFWSSPSCAATKAAVYGGAQEVLLHLQVSTGSQLGTLSTCNACCTSKTVPSWPQRCAALLVEPLMCCNQGGCLQGRCCTCRYAIGEILRCEARASEAWQVFCQPSWPSPLCAAAWAAVHTDAQQDQLYLQVCDVSPNVA